MARRNNQRNNSLFSKILKLLLFLVIVGFISLAGYAYFGDLSPDQTEIRQPVLLNVD